MRGEIDFRKADLDGYKHAINKLESKKKEIDKTIGDYRRKIKGIEMRY